MIQTGITIVIVGIAVAYTAYKVYRFLKKPEEEFACSPEKCSTCSLKTTQCQDFEDDPKKD